MAGYNLTRTVDELLQRTAHRPASFTVHLFPEHWRLNDGGKFLYNNQVASLLDDIRAHRIPVDLLDLFDAAKVPFYDGCMLVELLDYRPSTSNAAPLDSPERTRVVLHPNAETMYSDIAMLNQKHGNKWTDRDVLQVESRLLLATAPPLCLDPDPHLTRVANHVLRVSTPMVPVSLKRKVAALAPEEHEIDRTRRTKIMQFMDPRQYRSHAPSYRIQNLLDQKRIAQVGASVAALTPAQQQQVHDYQVQLAQIRAQQAGAGANATASGSSPPNADAMRMAMNKTPATAYLGAHSQHQNLMGHPSPNHRASPMVPYNAPAYPAPAEQAARTPTPSQRAPTPAQRAMTPSQRAPTPAHRALTPGTRQSPQIGANAAPAATAPTVAGFQPVVPPSNFLQPPPPQRQPPQAKASGSTPANGFQQQQSAAMQAQQLAYQKQMQAMQAQAAHAGRATPQMHPAGLPQPQQQRINTTRSPIPPNAQAVTHPQGMNAYTVQQQQQQQQQFNARAVAAAKQQQQQHPYQANYNFAQAAAQAGYAMRPTGYPLQAGQQPGAAGYPSYSGWPPANGVGGRGMVNAAAHAQMIASANKAAAPQR